MLENLYDCIGAAPFVFIHVIYASLPTAMHPRLKLITEWLIEARVERVVAIHPGLRQL